MSKHCSRILIALAAFAALPAYACPPPMNPPTFQEELTRSTAQADAAFEAKVLVNEHIAGPGPAGSYRIKLAVIRILKGKPSPAALEVRIHLSGTTCDRGYLGIAGSQAVIFSAADGKHLWAVEEPKERALVVKYLQESTSSGAKSQ